MPACRGALCRCALQLHPAARLAAQVRLGGYEMNGLPGSYEARWAKWAAVHPSAHRGASGEMRFDFALLLLDRPARTRPTLRLPPHGALPARQAPVALG